MLRAIYTRAEDFLRDHEQQIARGGLLVRGDIPPDLERGAAVDLELVTPAGTIRLEAQVIQILAGVGVAVTVSPDQVTELVDAVRSSGRPAAPEPSHGAATARKIQLALHGDKSQRAAILREPNKMIHGYVLRNPQIQLDEVAAIARMTTVAIDVLTFIASRREWAERPEIAVALVRNPRTPVPLAIKLLDRVSPTELRQLAKQSHVREPIQRAARKKVIG
ncbi:MAG TPA: hypothetical protein VKB80_17470 [Kofleriaceae bacterium]|nr:hypothetical protein [Kofleriaceae bacterium]